MLVCDPVPCNSTTQCIERRGRLHSSLLRIPDVLVRVSVYLVFPDRYGVTFLSLYRQPLRRSQPLPYTFLPIHHFRNHSTLPRYITFMQAYFEERSYLTQEFIKTENKSALKKRTRK